MTTATYATSRAGLDRAGGEQATGTPRAGIREVWERFRAYQETLSELRALSDRQLGDLGMSRDSLKGTARQAVYGNRG